MADSIIEIKGYFKRGSSWDFALIRKNPDQTPVDLTGLVTRAMFRRGDPDGEVVTTLVVGSGITIPDPLAGRIDLRVSKDDSEKFAAGDVACFDVEQENPLDPTYAWQSLTYAFEVIEQVTRDD